MPTAKQPAAPTWKYAALRGAELGTALTFAYTFLFVMYAGIRSALTILQSGNVDAGVWPTILATTASLLWTSLLAGALFAILAVGLGAVSGVFIWGVLRTWNPQHSAGRSVLLGVAVTALLAVLGYVVLSRGIDLAVTPSTGEALAFWLGLPMLIYIAAGGFGGWMLDSAPGARASGQVIL